MDSEEMIVSVERIKQTIRWFPGLSLGLKRRVGKTTAILEVIHEDYGGHAIVFSPNTTLSRNTEKMYREKYPTANCLPNFISLVQQVRGLDLPIFVDEWWNIPVNDRRNLAITGRVVCRIGTEY
jgi:hypothetical protein